MNHIKWLSEIKSTLQTDCGKKITVVEFVHKEDAATLSAWAKHFRQHYCLDVQIDALRQGMGLTRKEYLDTIIFPDSKTKPGPSVRAGDFAEILVSDYLEYKMNFWVPRTRYDNKASRNESTKGSDVIGFGQYNPANPLPTDELRVIESKAKLSEGKLKNILQEAIDHSGKDEFRLAVSLNAIKRRLYEKGLFKEVEKVKRFQNKAESDYKIKYGAFVVLNSSHTFSDLFSKATTGKHPKSNDVFIVVIHGKDLMRLAHSLYKRAADEAGP